MPAEDFTPDGYRTLLQSLIGLGYAVRAFPEVTADDRAVVLRHDIDFSLEAALEIGEIEAAMGVRSIFFALVGSELYNPFTAAGRTVLGRLRALGHDLGLHFDAAAHGTADLDLAADGECRLLGQVVGAPVGMISFHRPEPGWLGAERAIAGRPHTYQPRHFSALGYCSDSSGEWRHGHPLDHAAVRGRRALQLLTHPIWWTARAGETPRERLDRLALGRLDRVRATIARECRAYPRAFADLDADGAAEAG
ncbi:MAG: hypothetical protein EXQ96_07635 [Alphaproteobacteria bacterium]|nr:hypothetical protein [Alphaproteobacteria bacterium]